MAVDDTKVTDQGTNEGDPGPEDGDKQTVDNKADASDKKATDQQDEGQTKEGEGDVVDKKATSVLGDKEDDNGDGKKDDVDSQAPEKYDEFTLPQGFTMNELALEAFNPAAKELGLSQDNAQKMIDLYAKLQQSEAEKFSNEFFDKAEKDLAEVKADSLIGGNNFDSSVSTVNKVIKKFGEQSVFDFLENTGGGVRRDVLTMFKKIGDAMGEDVFIDENDGGGVGSVGTTEKSLGDRLYPNMKT